MDFCGSAHKTFKNLTNDQRNDINVFRIKLFCSAKFRPHEASLGLRRTFATTYIQNQLAFRAETLHKSGLYSKASAIFGDAVTGKLVMRKFFRGSFRTQFLRKPLPVSLVYQTADGATLLNVPRDENTLNVSRLYQLNKSLPIGLGYTRTNSKIDYFDVLEPNLKIYSIPKRF